MTTPNSWDSDPLGTPTTTPQHAATPLSEEALGSTDDDTFTATTQTYGSGLDDAGAHTADEGSSGSSTAQDAKSKAQDAASSVADHGADVAGTAKQEAQQVAGEAKAKATDLLAEARSQVDEQSRTQLSGLASKLEELSDELDDMVSSSTTQGPAVDLAGQLAERTRSLSTHLSSREPMDLVEDVRTFARQRPGAFLVGAAAVGILAGRLTRGAKKANDTTTDTTSDTFASDGSTGGLR